MHILRVAGAVAAVILLLGFAGLLGDLFGGLKFTRSEPSWPLWVGGLIVGGLIYAVTEGAFEWVTSGDRTTDPLGKRVLRLIAGILVVGGLLVIVFAVFVRLSP